MLAQKKGKTVEAIADNDRALQLDPADAFAREQRGMLQALPAPSQPSSAETSVIADKTGLTP
jgi:hypothetical protein